MKRLLRNVNADSACSACFAALVRALHQADEEGLRIMGPISIGQGYEYREFDEKGRTILYGSQYTPDDLGGFFTEYYTWEYWDK